MYDIPSIKRRRAKMLIDACEEAITDMYGTPVRVFMQVGFVTTSFDKIANAVAEVFQVPVDLIKSKTRRGEIPKARYVIMKIMQDQFGSKLKYYEIGNMIGITNHATIIHGLREFRELCISDPEYLKKYNKVLDLIAT